MDAAVYVRISLDQRGEGLGVARQEQDCRELVARRGWNVHHVYSDNDISAFSGRPRPAYRRMLKDVKAGVIGAIVAWDPDRLYRRGRDLVELIDLVGETKCELETVMGGTVDLNTANGRMLAKIVGAVAEHESDHKGERIKRQKQQAREQGLPTGGERAYGYEIDHMTIRESEAAVIHEVAARLLAGERRHGVAHDLNRRGIPTAKGSSWSAQALTKIIANARISGRVQVLQGANGRRPRGADGMEIRLGRIIGPAKWPAIIGVEDSDKLRAMVENPRPKGRPVSYLLTGGIAICGICGQPLRSLQSSGLRRMVCLKQAYHEGRVADRNEDPACGRIAITNAPVEEIVTEAVLRAVERGALNTLFSGPDVEALDELVEVETRLNELANDYGELRISRSERDASREPLSRRQKDLERRLQVSRARDGLDALPNPLRPAWPGLKLEQKRAVIKAVVDAVVINPPVRHGPGVLPQRITIRWK